MNNFKGSILSDLDTSWYQISFISKVDTFSSSVIRILKEQIIEKNHQKIIPKYSESKLFFAKKCNIAFFLFLYNIFFEFKSYINFERNKNYKKKQTIFRFRVNSSRIRIRDSENQIRCKIVRIRKISQGHQETQSNCWRALLKVHMLKLYVFCSVKNVEDFFQNLCKDLYFTKKKFAKPFSSVKFIKSRQFSNFVQDCQRAQWLHI